MVHVIGLFEDLSIKKDLTVNAVSLKSIWLVSIQCLYFNLFNKGPNLTVGTTMLAKMLSMNKTL